MENINDQINKYLKDILDQCHLSHLPEDQLSALSQQLKEQMYTSISIEFAKMLNEKEQVEFGNIFKTKIETDVLTKFISSKVHNPEKLIQIALESFKGLFLTQFQTQFKTQQEKVTVGR